MGEKTWKCIAVFSIILSMVAIAISGYALYDLLFKVNDKLEAVNSNEGKLHSLINKNVANLTRKATNEREMVSHTMSLLKNETMKLRQDYMKLLGETRALNRTINYTTSSTVQQALEELIKVKETQNVILKELKALAHLNDTAEDYLNLRKEVKNLTREVNRNITRVESSLKDSHEEWQKLLKKQQESETDTSEIKSNISDLERRLKKLEKRTDVNKAGALGLAKISKLMLINTIVFFVTFQVAEI